MAYMSSATSDAVINKLQNIFARWVIQDEIFSENGQQFLSDQFYPFIQVYDFRRASTSPLPSATDANGEVGKWSSRCQEEMETDLIHTVIDVSARQLIVRRVIAPFYLF